MYTYVLRVDGVEMNELALERVGYVRRRGMSNNNPSVESELVMYCFDGAVGSALEMMVGSKGKNEVLL